MLRSRTLAFFVLIAHLCTGCASIFRPATETVSVSTGSATVKYQDSKVTDGDSVSVRRAFDVPAFTVEDGKSVRKVSMDFRPHPWLIGDAALLVVFLLPGLVALGVDLGTGAWRDLEDRQVVTLPVIDEPTKTVASPKEAPPAESSGDPLRHPIQP